MVGRRLKVTAIQVGLCRWRGVGNPPPVTGPDAWTQTRPVRPWPNSLNPTTSFHVLTGMPPPTFSSSPLLHFTREDGRQQKEGEYRYRYRHTEDQHITSCTAQHRCCSRLSAPEPTCRPTMRKRNSSCAATDRPARSSARHLHRLLMLPRRLLLPPLHITVPRDTSTSRAPGASIIHTRARHPANKAAPNPTPASSSMPTTPRPRTCASC
jgi:hypothetical protein